MENVKSQLKWIRKKIIRKENEISEQNVSYASIMDEKNSLYSDYELEIS